MIDYSDYISAFFIWYVPMVIFTFFVFDILGVKKIFSLIPIYNVYKLLDEYQGRVWKKHWGVFYVIIIIFPILYLFEPRTIFILEAMIFILLPISIILSFLVIFIIFLFLVVIYIPLLRNKILKSTLILNILLHILIFIFIFVDSIYITVLITFFNYFYAFVAFDTWRKVKSGKYVVYEKLDYSKLSSSDIKAELASRGRILVHPLEQREKLEPKAELIEEKEQLEKSN
ncbi:hypothetical protein [Gemella sanguinis]|uniref:hypothetical protein n=1 Tax=Gemella sanguinis TaxID=84135 RepID=UPI0008076E9F|nr:hypothetical protein [Gemella sanguinis]